MKTTHEEKQRVYRVEKAQAHGVRYSDAVAGFVITLNGGTATGSPPVAYPTRSYARQVIAVLLNAERYAAILTCQKGESTHESNA